MSVNRFRPHLFVIPEDAANAEIAAGFVLHHSIDVRRIQIMPEAGGWTNVISVVRDEYHSKLGGNPNTHVVLLLDFDNDAEDRRSMIEADIPEDIRERVFVLGTRNNPEDLKRELKQRLEDIGSRLAMECIEGRYDLWSHQQLAHNEPERDRLRQTVWPFLHQA